LSRKNDGFVKNLTKHIFVIPAKTGIQYPQ